MLLFVTLLLAACGGGGGGTAGANNTGNNTSVVSVPPYTSADVGANVTVQNLGITSATVIVDTSNSAVQVSADTSTGKTTVVLPSSSATNQIQPGAPLVIGVSAATPEGYLGKVEQVSSQGGQVQVTAVQGKLSDFIADCDMSIKGSLQTSDIQSSKPLVAGVSYAPSKTGRFFKGIYRKAALITTIQFQDVVLYDKDGNSATTNDQILVNGSLDYGLDYQFDLKASNFKLQQLQFVVTPWQAGDFTLSSTQTVSISKSVPVKTISFKPFTIWIPITPLVSLPLVIKPEVAISVGVDGQLSASLSAGFTESSDISGGVLYSSGLWSPVSSQNISLSATMPTVSANASLTAYIEPKVTFKIYGQIAPYAAPRGYLRFTADTAADPWWELYGGLKMGVGITVTVVGYDLVDYANNNVIGYEVLIASPPTAPQNPTVSSGNGQATVSWSAVTGATSYNLYWDTVPVVTRLTANKITGVTSPYVHTGLTNGTTYYYMITAENSLGEGAGSTTVSTIPTVPKPGVPAGVSASAGNGQVTLSWTAVTGATSYNVYYRATTAGVTTANGTKVTGATSGGAITGLTNGTAYYFIVTAVNAGGESAASTEVGATPQVPAPGAPTGVGATAGNGQATVSWAAVTGATSYNVYYRTTAGVTTVNGTKVTGATSGGAITGLTNGTAYYFIVTAVNASGESAVSSEVSATPTGVIILASSLNYPNRLTIDQVNVYWTESTAIKKVGLNGGAVTTIGGSAYPWGIAVDTNSIYVAANPGSGGGWIFQAPLNGGTSSTLASANQPYDIYVDSNYVYWAENNGGPYGSNSIRKVPIGGGSVITLHDTGTVHGVMAVDNNDIYFRYSGGGAGEISIIAKVNKNGGSVIDLATYLVDIPSGIAVDVNNVYWVEPSSGFLKMVSINGGIVTSLAASLNDPRRLVVDANNVYWVEFANGVSSSGTVKKVPKSGGVVTTLASGLNGPCDIAIDNTYIYWTERGTNGTDGAVKKIIK